MISQEQIAYDILQTLFEAGWEAFIAGGAARDLVCGRCPEDFDVVTRAPYEVIRRLFKRRKTVVVGESFKVCLVDGVEVATYRKKDNGLMQIELGQTIHEDLARRDFTINAMAYCPLTGDIVDDFGGIDDLKNKIIRFTGNPQDRIREDPCRIIRACRFLAKLEGRFDPDTFQVLKENQNRVREKVAFERIRLEILKVLKYSKPSIFFDALFEIGLLDHIFPGLFACYGHDGGIFHAETIDYHSKLTGDELPRRKPLLRLTGYLHDIGKPASAVIKEGHLKFIGHAEAGAELVHNSLARLKFSHQEQDYVSSLARHHMRNLHPADKPKTVRKHLKKLQDDGVDWKDWLYLKVADTRSNLKKDNMKRRDIRAIVLAIRGELKPVHKKPVFQIKDLAINGQDLIESMQIEPGPVIGRILNQLLGSVIEEPEQNDKRTLMQMAKAIIANTNIMTEGNRIK